MADFFSQQRQANQQLMNAILPTLIRQRLQQQNPLNQLLQQGQAAQALNQLSQAGVDVSDLARRLQSGLGQGGQPQLPQGQPQIQLPQGQFQQPQTRIPTRQPIQQPQFQIQTGPIQAPTIAGQFRAETLKRSPFGFQAEELKRVPTTQEKQQELEFAGTKKRQELALGTQAQIETQRQKDVLKTGQDLLNAELKIGNSFEAYLDTVNRTLELTGGLIKPGIVSGSITKILGETRANEFFKGFKGGLTEYAAAVGRIAIPGARAVRLVTLFKGTAAGTFDTIPSAIVTTALSFKNALATDMSRNPKSYLPSYRGRQDNPILQGMLRDFEKEYKDGLYRLAFNKNPQLIPAGIRSRLSRERQQAIQELRRRGRLNGQF